MNRQIPHAKAEVSQTIHQSVTPNRRITSKVARELCGSVSDMTLWRWLHDTSLNFPKPTYIGKRRYWKESDVIGWLEQRATEPA
jgi:predicted DNA-binding transcriptional regulator AlpA